MSNKFVLRKYNLNALAVVLCAILSFSVKGSFGQFVVNGSAYQESENCYVLTPDEKDKAGSAWNSEAIDLRNPFHMKFEVYLGCNNTGADGIAFGFHNNLYGLGVIGGGLGYGSLSPLLVVEIDTWNNNTYDNNGDPDYDHIAVLSAGAAGHNNAAFNHAGPVQASATSTNVEDCQMHRFDILWEPAKQTLSVYFDDEFRLSYTGNIAAQFFYGNPRVYWGFTGATGGVSDVQKFCILSTCNSSCCVPQVYAGPDDLFCYDRAGYKLSSAFAVYERLTNWETRGDGLFDDATSANPVYYPGLTDIASGKVTLVLKGIGDGLCGDSFDPMDLSIIQVDPETIDLNIEHVSTNIADETTIDVGLQIVGLEPLADSVTLERRERGKYRWDPLANLALSSTAYSERDMNTGSTVYEYRMSVGTICGEVISSSVHNTILLDSGNYTAVGVDLRWNSYKNWPSGVDQYEIWRKVDGEKDFVLFQTIAGTDSVFHYNDVPDGISHSFRVLAKAPGMGTPSWSNTLQVDFEKELYFPNVITPNGDGYNDEFIILNAEYYPENNLKIFNRWGRLVFERKGYINSWRGEEVSNGVYYYSFRSNNENNKKITGWVQVMK